MHDVNYKKPSIATNKEIFIVFITFSLILTVLYPKDLLKTQILAKNSNYDLSILYLKNILNHDPKNEDLMYDLAKLSLRGKEKDLAPKLLKTLLHSKNQNLRAKAYRLNYQIAKENYFYLLKDKKKNEANKVYKKLQSLNRYIVKHHYYDQKNIYTIYQETLFLKNQKNSFYILKELLRESPNNIKYIEESFYLANILKKKYDALILVNKLIKLDKVNQEKWKKAKYYLLYNSFSKERAGEYLFKEAQKSPYWLKRLARFYLGEQKYKISSKIYMQLYQKASTKEDKMKYWIQAIRTLQAGNYLQEAADLGAIYQHKFIDNPKVRLFLLKLYLATNNLDRANYLAQELLKIKSEK